MSEVSQNQTEAAAHSKSLRELALLFLRLGTTAMGGPAAHIAMMEDEVVRRRRWLSREYFLDMLGATNLIPGPNSTEMAIHIGHQQAGFSGLVVAGACFIVPAVLIVLAIACAYVRFGAMPSVRGLLYGVKPVIIAVVLQALWGLGKTAIRSRILAVLAAVSLAAAMLQVNDLVVLLGGGLVMIAIKRAMDEGGIRATIALPSLAALSAGAVAVPFSLTTLFLFFSKSGRFCLAAATFCSRSSALISSSDCTGSAIRNCSMLSRLDRLRPGRCSPPRPSLAICSAAFQARSSRRSESSCPRSFSSVSAAR